LSAITKAAEGEQCTVNIAEKCNYDPTTVALAHLRWLGGCGMGIKPNDLQGVFACCICHDLIDGRSPGLSKDDRNFYALRALARTHIRLAEKLGWKT